MAGANKLIRGIPVQVEGLKGLSEDEIRGLFNDPKVYDKKFVDAVVAVGKRMNPKPKAKDKPKKEGE